MWKIAGLLLLALGALDPGHGEDRGTLEIIETSPVGTTLDVPELREFVDVWRERIRAAEQQLALAHFYASDEEGGRLSGILEELEQAASRGVQVRFLVDQRFCDTYPETALRLERAEGIELRRYDMRAVSGGVMHAKYLLADGEWVCLGSANFDWRSLEHIQELGALVRSRQLAAAFLEVFEYDWHLAGGGALEDLRRDSAPDERWPVELDCGGGETVLVRPVFTPTEHLPHEDSFSLPRIVKRIDAAREVVSIQLLTYRAVGYDREYFEDLESALRRAAAREVSVRLLVADWGKRPGTIEGLKSLQLLPGIEVRLVTLPPAEGGHIPFARVIHSKFMVVDGASAWIGTSNWEASYFEQGRNAGLLLDGAAVGRILTARFERTWGSEYAYPVDPCADYEVPRIGD